MLPDGRGSCFQYTVVMKIPFLNWLEQWALGILVKSPRTGMVAVKQMDGPLLFIANSPFDEMPMNNENPMAQHLERIYQNSGDGTPQGPD
jgi:hypothetical protein